MKKRFTLGIVATMMLSLMTGCGAKSKDGKYSKYMDLGEYKGVEADTVSFELSDEEVKSAIEESMYEYITYDEVTDRSVKEGDYANIDYSVIVDGKKIEDYSETGAEMCVGEAMISEQMDEKLIGMNIGDKTEFETELTEDLATDGDAGKKAKIEIKLNGISVENCPEYNEEFVKNNTDYKTIDEYEKSIKDGLEAERKDEYKAFTVQQIMDKIIDDTKFDGYPDDLYKKCEEDFNAENEYMAEMYGMELAEYEEMLGLDDETKKEEITQSVYFDMVMYEVADKEGIKVSDDDAKKYAEDKYEVYGYESADELLGDYSLDEIKEIIIFEKVGDFLYDNAKLTKITEDEYIEKYETEDEGEEAEDGLEYEVFDGASIEDASEEDSE